MDTMELDTTALPVEAMGRFWGALLLLQPGSCLCPVLHSSLD
jgi:hypothetical protein